MDVRITFDAQLPIEYSKREKWYLASCPLLDVHSQGETKEKAKGNLSEAIQLFLISCFERGSLDNVLKDCGFRPLRDNKGEKPLRTRNYIDVQIPLTTSKSAEPLVCPA